MPVVPDNSSKYNQSVPPDTLWLRFPEDKGGGIVKNKTFAYSFRGEIYKEDNEIDLKVNKFSVINHVVCLEKVVWWLLNSLNKCYIKLKVILLINWLI